MKAYVDLKTNPKSEMIRCPHCNSWDYGMIGAKAGDYTCDECGGEYEFDGDISQDTVPEDIRKEMDEAVLHNAKFFNK